MRLRRCLANMPLRGWVGLTCAFGAASSVASQLVEPMGSNTTYLPVTKKPPKGGFFLLLAERVAKISLPGKSEEVQNPFTILHLANFMR